MERNTSAVQPAQRKPSQEDQSNTLEPTVHEQDETASRFTMPGISNEDMRAQIAEAAYYLAERRGFAAGGEVEDWLAAEEQIKSSRGLVAAPN
jgi:hypothetical protein